MNWGKIVETFDRPERLGAVDGPTLKMLVAILLNSPKETTFPAVVGLWSKWSNQLWQIKLLDALASLTTDTFSFAAMPGRRVLSADDTNPATGAPGVKTLAPEFQGLTWNSLDLYHVLVRAGDSDSQEVQAIVRDVLDKATKIAPELVYIGLLMVNVSVWLYLWRFS